MPNQKYAIGSNIPIVRIPPWKCPHCGDTEHGYEKVYDCQMYERYDKDCKCLPDRHEVNDCLGHYCRNPKCEKEICIERKRT